MAGAEGERLLPLAPMGALLCRTRSRGRTRSWGRSSTSRRSHKLLSLLHDGVEWRLLLQMLLLLLLLRM